MEALESINPEMIKFNNLIYKYDKDLISSIDKVEDWTSNNKEVVQKVKDLFSNIKTELDNNKTMDFDNFISALAYFNTSNVMKLLADLEESSPKLVNELLKYIMSIQDSGSSLVQRLFAERLLYTYRISIIPLIFSRERLDALDQTIKQL